MRHTKDLIYFPSLSSFEQFLKKDTPIINDLSFKFYNKNYYGDKTHPYFLLSAGMLYKNENVRENLEMQDAIVFGDSGGHQIATGALKWDVNLRETIFHWLERNSDVAMNIDIPPPSTKRATGGKVADKKRRPFDECLNITVDNMKWFEKNQTGKTDFLNVIQCQSTWNMENWYNGVKDFKEFKGWGAGGLYTIHSIMKLLLLFFKNKEFDNPNFKWFHFLGATSVSHFFIYAVLQNKLNQYFPHIQVTTDSSSPKMMMIFGDWAYSVNYEKLTFNKIYFGNNGKTNYKEDENLPCIVDCPVCKHLTFKNIASDGNTKMINYGTYHNLFVMIENIKNINKLSVIHFEGLKDIIPGDFYKVLSSIVEMFDSGNPQAVYEKYLPLYMQFDSKYPMKSEQGDDLTDDDWLV